MHLKFAELSGNSALFQVASSFAYGKQCVPVFSAITTMGEAGSYKDHEVILKAVYERDADAAAAAMEEHLDNLIKIVSKSMEN